MKTFKQIYSESAKSAKDHMKLLNHTALPIVTAASNDISDIVEYDDKKNREWLRLTGDAQIAIMDMIDFIKKNT